MSARVAARDLAVVATQLGRAPHPFERVVARCPWGRPAVVENLPYDATGRPFPTLFWATCPSLVAAVAALESRGGVRAFERRAATEPDLCLSLRGAVTYERRRRRALALRCGSGARDGRVLLLTGVGGVRDPARLKCLHAHAAHALARPRYTLGAAILEAAAPLWNEASCCSDAAGTRPTAR
jgi:hypothetical protein